MQASNLAIQAGANFLCVILIKAPSSKRLRTLKRSMIFLFGSPAQPCTKRVTTKWTMKTRVEVDGSKVKMRLNSAKVGPLTQASSIADYSDSLLVKCL